jgi:hypothetical protein
VAGRAGASVLFWLLWRFAQKQGERLCWRALRWPSSLYGVFQMAVAMIMLAIPALIRVAPDAADALSPPGVFLHDFDGRLPAGQISAQGQRLALGGLSWRPSMEECSSRSGCSSTRASTWNLPGRASANPWLQAFDWIRQNTPTDAYFALDPEYMAAPGEDYHSFRALAERSQLADNIKDRRW